MSCQEHRFQITAWIDGSFDGNTSELEAHLGSCLACARFRREQLELNALLNAPDLEHELPAGIWAAVQTRIEGQNQSAPAGFLDRLREWVYVWHGSTGPAYGLAGMAALLLLSLSLFQLPKGPDADLLAQLDNYSVERAKPGNPFLTSDFDTGRGNPFAAGRRP
jgi:hypothetical protein